LYREEKLELISPSSFVLKISFMLNGSVHLTHSQDKSSLFP